MIKEKIFKITWNIFKFIAVTCPLSICLIFIIEYMGVEKNTLINVTEIICAIHICIGVIVVFWGILYIRSTIKWIQTYKYQKKLENFVVITNLIESFQKLVNSNSSFYEAQREYVKIRRLLDDPNFSLDESKLSEIIPIFDELTSRMIKLDSGKQ